MTKIDFKIDGIGHFISDNYLKVPIYQRPYAWMDDNVTALFQDIKESSEEYFIGTIVVANKGDYVEIIDGQQRLATITIFYSAVRNFMLELNDDKGASLIGETYLFKQDLRTRDSRPKLELGVNDNEYFKNLIVRQNGSSNIKNKESHERIEQAYNIAYRFVKNEYASYSNQFARLYDLIDFLKDKVKIIVVEVSDEANAFTIFETLNDRGLSLSQTDLIKNYLFHKSGSRLSEAQEKWARFTGTIEAADNEEQILQFIRYHWSSKYGLTREKELFRSIKTKITNQNQTITYLSELESDVYYYIALLNPNHSFWTDYPSNCKEYIKTLLELQLYQNRPLLLSLLKRFSITDVEKAFKLILAWSVRNLITGSIGTGTLEKEFSNQAKLINDSNVKTLLEFKNSITKLVPTDDAFKSQFKIATISKNYIARYYLSEIEKIHHATNEQEPSRNTEIVSLEHILPEKPDLKEDWKNFTEEQHNTYYKRIGNLTLLDKKMNSSQKSASFAVKKDIYKQSEILITSSLADYNNWTTDDIEKRQKEFAEKAVEIWNLKIQK